MNAALTMMEHNLKKMNDCICTGCGQSFPKKLQKCSGCRMGSYCSSECAKKHWPEHKEICKYTKQYLIEHPDEDSF